jgi:hypothetical protein
MYGFMRGCVTVGTSLCVFGGSGTRHRLNGVEPACNLQTQHISVCCRRTTCVSGSSSRTSSASAVACRRNSNKSRHLSRSEKYSQNSCTSYMDLHTPCWSMIACAHKLEHEHFVNMKASGTSIRRMVPSACTHFAAFRIKYK